MELIRRVHSYSDPNRDPRHHTITTVYIVRAKGTPKAQDDAIGIGIFTEENLPDEIAIDHREILTDYFRTE